MSFFRELKYQLIGTFDDLAAHMRLNGEAMKGKSSEKDDFVLIFQHNQDLISSKLIYDEKDNMIVFIEILDSITFKLTKLLFSPTEVLMRVYNLDKDLNPIGGIVAERVITDKYTIADVIVEFKRQHKATNKIHQGKKYTLPITW